MKIRTCLPLLMITAAGLMTSACTVTDLDEQGNPVIPQTAQDENSGYSNMSPEAIAESLWDSQVVPAYTHSGINPGDIADLTAELESASDSRSVFMKIHGPVTAVKTSKHINTVTVSTEAGPVELQFGPIIKGNSLRDALNLSFDDFSNQVQFAKLSKALNRKATGSLKQPDDSWKQRTIDAVAAVHITKDGIDKAVPLSISEESQP